MKTPNVQPACPARHAEVFAKALGSDLRRQSALLKTRCLARAKRVEAVHRTAMAIEVNRRYLKPDVTL